MSKNIISKLISNISKYPINNWSFGNGAYIKHIQAIDSWLIKYSDNKGVYFSSKNHQRYPEVTGYFIETLLKWGYTTKAKGWFYWLCFLQNKDGGWQIPTLSGPSVFFDSAQIIRGIKEYSDYSKVNSSKQIKSYLSYFLKNKQDQLIPQNITIKDINWYLVNLQAAWIVHKYWPNYISTRWITSKLKKAFSVWDVGYQNSHLDLYILEAMFELKIFPQKFNRYVEYFDSIIKKYGMITCDRKNYSVCYTATAQMGVLYYKMGRIKDADNLLFKMLTELDIRRKNWPASAKGGNYIPNHDVSWTIKFFLDMLYCYSLCKFDLSPDGDWSQINTDFGETIISNIIKISDDKKLNILDVGCGLGRYMNKWNKKHHVFGVDISQSNVNYCHKIGLKVVQGSFTNFILPKNYPDKFDLIYSVEAFEHSVFPSNAIAKMKSYLSKTGKIIIVDKDPYSYPYYKLCVFEKYFSKREYKWLARKNGMLIKSIKNIGGFIICEMMFE